MKKLIPLFLLAICCTQLSQGGRTNRSGSFSSKKEKSKRNGEKRRKNKNQILDKNILRSITQSDFEQKQRLQAEKIETRRQKNRANFHKAMALWNKKAKKDEFQTWKRQYLNNKN